MMTDPLSDGKFYTCYSYLIRDPYVDFPDDGIVLKGLQDSIINANVQFNGARKQLVVDLGRQA